MYVGLGTARLGLARHSAAHYDNTVSQTRRRPVVWTVGMLAEAAARS